MNALNFLYALTVSAALWVIVVWAIVGFLT